MRAITRDNVIRLVSDGRGRLSALGRTGDARVDPEQQERDESEIAAQLVARIRAGDRAAEAELIERYQPRLLYVLRRQMLQQPHDVEDVAQSALTATIVRLRAEAIEAPERLGGFIYGIARILRRENQRLAARHRSDADPEMLDRLPDGSPEPERLVAGVETTTLLRRVLAELGETSGTSRDREVLVRLYVMEQSRDEVCRSLRIAPEHLRRVVHRARQRLKGLMREAQRPARADLADSSEDGEADE